MTPQFLVCSQSTVMPQSAPLKFGKLLTFWHNIDWIQTHLYPNQASKQKTPLFVSPFSLNEPLPTPAHSL